MSFWSPFTTTELLAAASNPCPFTATGPDKVAYSMLKHLLHSGMNFLLHNFNLSWPCIPSLPSGRHFLLFPFTRWENLPTPLLPSSISLSPSVSQSFLNASYYPVYSSFWNLISFFLPGFRPGWSTLDQILFLSQSISELCFDWSAGLSTGVFLSIRANVRPPSFRWIPTKLTSSYLASASVSTQLQAFLGSPSTTLFPFLNMYLC